MARYRLGCDVGGTFTDLVLSDDATGRLITMKVPTRRGDLARGVAEGIATLIQREGVPPAEVGLFVHGTTLATNTVLEGNGAPVGLLVTRGTRDVLELARLRLGDPTNFYSDRPKPLVPRHRVREVEGRLYADGSERDALDERQVVGAVDDLIACGARAIAVCFLHSYVDARHEQEAAMAIRRAFPELPVSLSSDVWPEQREYERAVVTVINAMLLERVHAYLTELASGLQHIGLSGSYLCTRSNGGVMAARTAADHPVHLLLSGPAAGVVGALELGRVAGESHLLTLDIGGTSADIAVIDGEVPYSTEGRVGDYPVLLPTVDVLSIGAGGGSVAWVDASGLLKVGPASVGSDPGPAAYGKGGTDATLTDAYLALGFIDAEHFLGGTMALDQSAARRALLTLGERLGLGLEEVASSIVAVATAAMQARLLPFLAARGVASHELTLYPYGGAGPTHAFLLARELGIDRIMIPPSPGTLCAVGCLVADLRTDLVRTKRFELTDQDLEELRETLLDLRERGIEWTHLQGIDVSALTAQASVDMRYQGQSFNLNVSIDPLWSAAEVRDAFERKYESVYFHRDPRKGVEIVCARTQVIGKVAPLRATRPEPPAAIRPPHKRTRRISVDGSWTEAAVVDRYSLVPGASFSGPAIVEQYDTTVVIPAGFVATVDDRWNIVGVKRP